MGEEFWDKPVRIFTLDQTLPYQLTCGKLISTCALEPLHLGKV